MPKRKAPEPVKRGYTTPQKSQRSAPAEDEWDKLSQREKFIRTARDLGCDETGEALDEALRTVGRARRR